MAPSSFRSFALAAACAFGFAALVTFIGFIYEKINQEEEEESELLENAEKTEPSRGRFTQGQRVASPQSRLDEVDVVAGELSSDQVIALLGFLENVDDTLLENILITISNCSAFTVNQVLIRENDGIPKLVRLLDHRDARIRTKALQTLANLANNLDNQQFLKDAIPNLLMKLKASNQHKEEVIPVLYLLVNMTVVNTWHHLIVKSVADIVRIISDPGDSKEIKTHALRLLVNLSCNEENTKTLMDHQVLHALSTFLIGSAPCEENIMRVLNVATNTLNKAQNNLEMMKLAGEENKDLMLQLQSLETSNPNEEIRILAREASQFLNQ